MVSECGTVSDSPRFGTYITPWWYINYYYDYGPTAWWRLPAAHTGGMNVVWGDGHVKWEQFASFFSGNAANNNTIVNYYYWLLDKTGYTP